MIDSAKKSFCNTKTIKNSAITYVKPFYISINDTGQLLQNQYTITLVKAYNNFFLQSFSISKTTIDISYDKLGMRVPAQVIKQLKTHDLRKLGNIRKI